MYGNEAAIRTHELLNQLLLTFGSADAVAEILAGENYGLAAAQVAEEIHELTAGSDAAHEAQYDWMVDNDASGWDEDTVTFDLEDDAMEYVHQVEDGYQYDERSEA